MFFLFKQSDFCFVLSSTVREKKLRYQTEKWVYYETEMMVDNEEEKDL